MPGRRPAAPPLGRLVASADFERVLGTRSLASTIHFSVHHLDSQPSRRAGSARRPGEPKLSTSEGRTSAQPVEDFPPGAPPRAQVWVGAIVPKRHAKRAVTRSLIKRQIRAATLRARHRLAPGLWIVRLRAGFDPARFTSGASPALRRELQRELDAVLAAASAPGRP